MVNLGLELIPELIQELISELIANCVIATYLSLRTAALRHVAHAATGTTFAGWFTTLRHKVAKGAKVQDLGGTVAITPSAKVSRWYCTILSLYLLCKISILPPVQLPKPPALRAYPLWGAEYFDAGTVCQLLRRGAAENNIAHLLSDAPTFQIPEAK